MHKCIFLQHSAKEEKLYSKPLPPARTPMIRNIDFKTLDVVLSQKQSAVQQKTRITR